MIWLRQSTASQEVPLGYFVDSTDGNSEEGGLTIANTDIKLWKTGATTLTNKNSGGATHISNGLYFAVLDATDTATIGPMVIFVHVSGALAVRVECCVLDEAVFDVVFGTTALSTYAGGAVASVTGAVGSVTGSVGSVTGSVGSVTGAVGSVTAGVTLAANAITAAATAADFTTEIQTGLATAAELAKVPKSDGTATWNATALASVQAEATDALNAYDPPTRAELSSDVATLATAANLATLAGYVDTEVAAIKTVTDKVDTAVELDGAVYRFTTNALEQAPTGGGAADGSGFTAIPWNAAWDAEVQSEVADALTAYDPPTKAELDTAAAALQTELDGIQADTEDLQTRLPAALVNGRIDATIDDSGMEAGALSAISSELAISTVVGAYIGVPANGSVSADIEAVQLLASGVQSAVDNIPTNAELATALAAADDAVLAAIPTADENADALLDRADAVETGLTPRGALRLTTSAIAGKLSGAETSTVTIRNVGDSKNRITATVTADGNRTSVTTDAT